MYFENVVTIGNPESDWKTHFTNTQANCSNCDPDLIQKCKRHCCAKLCFWGFVYGYNIGWVKAKFRSSGSGVLSLGNCHQTGQVHVYLDKLRLHSANPDEHAETVKFSYNAGQVLKIEEEQLGVIQINSLTLQCRSDGNAN